VSERLLTARELADRWGVSPATVLDWFEAGRLPGAIRLGGTPRGRLRWPESAVRAIEAAWTAPESCGRPLGVV
jgi:predicted DNA-binding transcriptional regulator AlpA